MNPQHSDPAVSRRLLRARNRAEFEAVLRDCQVQGLSREDYEFWRYQYIPSFEAVERPKEFDERSLDDPRNLGQ